MVPSPATSGSPRVRPLTSQDAAALQALLDHGGGYTRRVEGRDPRPGDAEAILASRPPGTCHGAGEADGPRAVVLGAESADGTLHGVLQMAIGWPTPEVAHIGLLLVDERSRAQGIGSLLHEHARQLAGEDPHVTTLRLAIVATNASAAVPFWYRLGYASTGEQRRHTGDRIRSTAHIWDRPLGEAPHRTAGLDHLELWTADLAAVEPGWAWLLGSLGWWDEAIEGWETGRIWRHGDGSYIVLEQSPDVRHPDVHSEPAEARAAHGAVPHRMGPGMNHLALTIRDRAALDRVRAAATENGWHELFAERYPHAGGPDSIAWYAENPEGIEVEVVAHRP